MIKRKVIINACLTGMVPTKKLNPNTPISPEEIIHSALKCAGLGASMIHLHARDENGKPTWKKEVYARIIEGIRRINKDLVICISTSGRNWKEFEKRSECLELNGDLKPDMATLTVGSMNFINQESVNSPEIMEKLALKMKETGIKPELEIFEPGMIHKANYLIGKGIVADAAPYFNLFLGSLGTAPLDATSFAAMYNLLPDNAVWSVAGIGMFQTDANILGLSMGGGIRTGLEDNIYFDREKKVLASNESLIERMAGIIKKMGLEIATPGETRKMLNLDK